MAKRKKKKLPQIDHLIGALERELPVKLFNLQDIPDAVAWAEQGNIAIHENYHSRRKRSYHVISGNREYLMCFCNRLGIDPEEIKESEFFRFWHLTWYPENRKEEPPCKNQGLTYVHPSC